MKKLLAITFAITALSFGNIYAQQTLELKGDNIFVSNISNEKDAYILGSKYIDEDFKSAIIDNGKKPFLLRFNILRNEFEYKSTDNKIIRLDRVYNKFEFKDYTFYKIIFKEFESGENKENYLIYIENSNLLIFKKLSKKFNSAIESFSSYESAKPANYVDLKPNYILKYKDQYFEIPKKAKELEKLFPEKANDLKSFIKSNKLKLDKEESLIKLAQFLNN